jgi:hypothetical protein
MKTGYRTLGYPKQVDRQIDVFPFEFKAHNFEVG